MESWSIFSPNEADWQPWLDFFGHHCTPALCGTCTDKNSFYFACQINWSVIDCFVILWHKIVGETLWHLCKKPCIEISIHQLMWYYTINHMIYHCTINNILENIWGDRKGKNTAAKMGHKPRTFPMLEGYSTQYYPDALQTAFLTLVHPSPPQLYE